MQLSDKTIQEFKDIMEKEYDKEVSWEEASEGAYNLLRLGEILLDGAIEDQQRQKKLEESPKGFHLEGNGYTCFICGNSASKEDTWYDKYGIKCMTCQKAINRRDIPASLAKNKDSWYSRWEIERSFNVKAPTLRRWVKEGILKARTVRRSDKRPHVQLFLIKDNKDTLPPKKMVESKMVRVEGAENSYRMEPWYRFVDPHEHLKGYKIMDYLQVTQDETQPATPIANEK